MMNVQATEISGASDQQLTFRHFDIADKLLKRRWTTDREHVAMSAEK